MATSARPTPFAAGVLVSHAGYYVGYSLRETAGAVATVRLWNNASAASGTLVATIALVASASRDFAVPDDGVWFDLGLFVEVVAGTVEGAIYLG